MIDATRLVIPNDCYGDSFDVSFPELAFPQKYSFMTHGEPILVTDPTYLADVDSYKDENATLLRERGSIVMDFGGDISCPVWWKSPYILLPVSGYYSNKDWDNPFPTESPVLPEDVVVLADIVGCDSGSFIFLPLTADIPPALQDEIQTILKQENGVALCVPAGLWQVFYEQWDTPDGKHEAWYRNIVLKWNLGS